MLITRIELENIKSYRSCTIDFRRGTTAISGSNGAGKTTLVEAIGFALFGYLPYSQDQFVREGERWGKVVVHLIGNDARPYEVERRCGSGSRWLIYDREANFKLEQRADVLDRLHELFGIDRDRSLEALFRDALGVPQGTFTSIFLETASKRKQTFDTLLQIEDYKSASDHLLDTQKLYRDQAAEQKARIDQLTFRTSELEPWRALLQEAITLNENYKQQHLVKSQELLGVEEQIQQLVKQQDYVQKLEQQLKQCQADYKHATAILGEREKQLVAAQTAQQELDNTRNDYQQYQQSQEALEILRPQVAQRNRLQQQLADQKKVQAVVSQRLLEINAGLQKVEEAHQKIAQLAPLVERQAQLEQERDEAARRKERYKTLYEEGMRLRKNLDQCQNQQGECQAKITQIEPLQPVADLLLERTESLYQLRQQANERTGLQRQLSEKRDLLEDKQTQRNVHTRNLRKTEQLIEAIEAHRQEAEELPSLESQHNEILAQIHRLEGNIEGYIRSRADAAGGQCPLLHETCLNIKQRGIVSLESYFDSLLTEEHAHLANLQQQLMTVTSRMAQIKKYADGLSQLPTLQERYEQQQESVKLVSGDVERLVAEIDQFTQSLEQLQHIDQLIGTAESAYNESKQADLRVRELSGLYKQFQQLQENARQYEADLQEKRREITTLKGCEEQYQQVERALLELGDPRSQSKIAQSVTSQEEQLRQRLITEQTNELNTLQIINDLEQQSGAYAQLDNQIAEVEQRQQRSQPGYLRYLKNEQVAKDLPTCTDAYQRQQELTQRGERKLQQVDSAYQQALSAFDQAQLSRVLEYSQQLRHELLGLVKDSERQQGIIHDLHEKIAGAERFLVELEEAQKEYQELEDLRSMTEHFRRLIKDAAPHVLRAMLADISAEANRIFGEVMGDRSVHLTWHNDYEIVLRRQGVERSFAQLSGGEQMSAALAVRLALLKKLSTLNIAFFDEPTQNMDELRRMNLADQIRRVRGFEQLLVISHDDTFEQGLDSLVRLQKIQGETRLVVDDDGSIEHILPVEHETFAF